MLKSEILYKAIEIIINERDTTEYFDEMQTEVNDCIGVLNDMYDRQIEKEIE